MSACHGLMDKDGGEDGKIQVSLKFRSLKMIFPNCYWKDSWQGLTDGMKERPHSSNPEKPWGSLSSPGTWLSGAQLPGLLGFPHGEEQAPGEQVELREEKGAKSESSPSTGLTFQKTSPAQGVCGILLHISNLVKSTVTRLPVCPLLPVAAPTHTDLQL